MSYRRRHRWFRRMALGLAFASVVFAGRVSVASAKFDEGTDGSRYVSAGGWSGLVDMESGVPLSAGIPEGDEQFIDDQAVQVIPYLSHGILTQSEAQSAAAEAIHDPYLTDLFVRPGEALGGPDGLAPDNRVERALNQSQQVIPYLSHGVLTETDAQIAAAQAIPDPNLGRLDGDAIAFENAVRPDDLANRFAHSDVPSRPEVASSGGSSLEWSDALTAGIGGFVLVLGLGLALGYLKRPKLAGL